MKHGELFAGSGGFSLGAEWAGLENSWSVEIDTSCCKKLKRNFDHKIIHKDVKKIEKGELQPVEIISGGDPCQPSSKAGLGKGQKDDRYLWHEMFRIIQELHPFAVVNENVDGTITNGIVDIKIDDLESEGYTCGAYILPAEAFGALHRRDRVWIIAIDPSHGAKSGNPGGFQKKTGGTGLQKRDSIQYFREPVDLWDFDSHANSERFQKQYNAAKSEVFQEGLSRYFGFGTSPHGNISRDFIESGIIRMLNGIPKGMDYPDRFRRIKELGNAIVPQIAYELFIDIKHIYELT